MHESCFLSPPFGIRARASLLRFINDRPLATDGFNWFRFGFSKMPGRGLRRSQHFHSPHALNINSFRTMTNLMIVTKSAHKSHYWFDAPNSKSHAFAVFCKFPSCFNIIDDDFSAALLLPSAVASFFLSFFSGLFVPTMPISHYLMRAIYILLESRRHRIFDLCFLPFNFILLPVPTRLRSILLLRLLPPCFVAHSLFFAPGPQREMKNASRAYDEL